MTTVAKVKAKSGEILFSTVTSTFFLFFCV